MTASGHPFMLDIQSISRVWHARHTKTFSSKLQKRVADWRMAKIGSHLGRCAGVGCGISMHQFVGGFSFTRKKEAKWVRSSPQSSFFLCSRSLEQLRMLCGPTNRLTTVCNSKEQRRKRQNIPTDGFQADFL